MRAWSPVPPALARLVARATKDPDVLAVLLFGNRARGDAAPSSDFDVCLVLGGEPRADRDRAEKRLEYLGDGDRQQDIREGQQDIGELHDDRLGPGA